jgi:hypothetical protein
VNASEATNGQADDNSERSETRVLARYGARDDERTKPSVMLLDWIGDDEVTVRWETVRRDTPARAFLLTADAADPEFDADDDDDFSPRRFRGIGGQAGSVILGVVLGAAVAIGVCALFAPAPPATSAETAVATAP